MANVTYHDFDRADGARAMVIRLPVPGVGFVEHRLWSRRAIDELIGELQRRRERLPETGTGEFVDELGPVVASIPILAIERSSLGELNVQEIDQLTAEDHESVLASHVSHIARGLGVDRVRAMLRRLNKRYRPGAN